MDAGAPLSLSRAKPVAQEVGAPWAGFHTFRHTFASLHLARGTTLVQLSRLLGHHSPEFTLRRYAHLIPGDEAAALDLSAELARVGDESGGAAVHEEVADAVQSDRPTARVR